jgi:death-on-curing protein
MCNHPFVDGNKRIGHIAKEVFLVLNRMEIQAHVNEHEAFILSLGSGKTPRDALTERLPNCSIYL